MASSASTSSRPSRSGIERRELLVRAGVLADLRQHVAPAEQDAPPLRLVLGEVERPGQQVVGLVHREGVLGTLSGREQIGDRPRRVARLRPVVREQPSEVGPVREPVLEVARDRAVEFPPGGARHRPVRAVADQDVLEAVLDVVGDVALGVPDDQPAVLERIQRIDHPVRRHHGGEHVAPEGVPDHRGVEQHRPRTRRERVDPRSDRREHRRGQFLWPSLVGDRGRELLEEQRVPFAGGHDAVDRRGAHLREQRRRDGHGLVRRERLERERGLADQAAPPRATGSRGARVARARGTPPARRARARRGSRSDPGAARRPSARPRRR